MLANKQEILGGELLKRSMQAVVASGRVTHAYIISGRTGFGKKMFAHLFAKAILCVLPNDGTACGTCKSCTTFDTGNNPDLTIFAPKKENYEIKEMREEVLPNMSIKPHFSERRVYIITKADTMNPQTQNAFLKSLEDGPKHIVFILLANSTQSFLATIMSRVIEYKIPPLNQETIYEELIKKGINKEVARTATWLADGGMGRALKIAENDDYLQMQNEIINLAKNIEKMTIADIFKKANELETYKKNSQDMIDIFKLYYRDKLVAGETSAIKKIHAIDDINDKLKRSCPYLLCMEIMLLNLAGKC